MNVSRFAFRAFAECAGRLPGVAYRLAPMAGWFAWRWNRDMRTKIVRNQLVLTGGDRDRACRNAKAVFTAVARYYVDIASIRYRDPRRLERGTIAIIHPERLAVLESGRPIIALSAHLGSPELGVQTFIGRGKQFVTLVEPLEPAWFSEEMNRLRGAGGGRYLPANGRGVRECLRTLHEGGIVALVGDRDIQGTGVCVNLLERRVRLPMGAFELGQRTGAMILPVLTTRGPRHTLRLHVEEAFAIGEAAGDVEAGVRRWATILEGYLRRYPEQWTVAEDFWRVHDCG